MSKPEWSVVARILIAAMKVGYYSLALSPAFAVAALFGEHKLTDKLLLNSFTNYVSIEEKVKIPRYIANCFMEVMCVNPREKTFSSVEHLEQFYQRYAPTTKKSYQCFSL